MCGTKCPDAPDNVIPENGSRQEVEEPPDFTAHPALAFSDEDPTDTLHGTVALGFSESRNRGVKTLTQVLVNTTREAYSAARRESFDGMA